MNKEKELLNNLFELQPKLLISQAVHQIEEVILLLEDIGLLNTKQSISFPMFEDGSDEADSFTSATLLQLFELAGLKTFIQSSSYKLDKEPHHVNTLGGSSISNEITLDTILNWVNGKYVDDEKYIELFHRLTKLRNAGIDLIHRSIQSSKPLRKNLIAAVGNIPQVVQQSTTFVETNEALHRIMMIKASLRGKSNDPREVLMSVNPEITEKSEIPSDWTTNDKVLSDYAQRARSYASKKRSEYRSLNQKFSNLIYMASGGEGALDEEYETLTPSERREKGSLYMSLGTAADDWSQAKAVDELANRNSKALSQMAEDVKEWNDKVEKCMLHNK